MAAMMAVEKRIVQGKEVAARDTAASSSAIFFSSTTTSILWKGMVLPIPFFCWEYSVSTMESQLMHGLMGWGWL